MTVAPERPSLARKHTRTSEQNRSGALDEGIRITAAGRVYEVRVGDLNALQERALRKQYGCSFTELMEEFDGSPGLDSIAAIIWLARYRQGERDLTYDEVAEDIDFNFADAMVFDKPGAEVTDSPEA